MNALSPLDDRYAARIADVSSLFSGFSFMKYRLLIECEYLIFVVSLLDPDSPDFDAQAVRRLHADFDEAELRKIHERERIMNHDVRALVDYVRSAVPESLRRWVHFGLTSQDINSPAMVMTYRDFNNTILGVELDRLTRLLTHLAVEHQDTVMLTFTHGQPAAPSTFGKQIAVFIEKLNYVSNDLFDQYQYRTKIGGSNGDLTGLKFCFPQVQWDNKLADFLQYTFELGRNARTTQIDDYINYMKLFQIYERYCYLLMNFCQDMWMYIHKGYLRLAEAKVDVGSSAMSPRISPIHFENAEGNLKIAAGLFHTIGTSISLSRMQRDLTDSTMLRNVGVACGHMTLAVRNICAGVRRVDVDTDEVDRDLEVHGAVFMDFYQLKLRQWGVSDAHDVCKSYARGAAVLSVDGLVRHLERVGIQLTSCQRSELSLDIDGVIRSV